MLWGPRVVGEQAVIRVMGLIFLKAINAYGKQRRPRGVCYFVLDDHEMFNYIKKKKKCSKVVTIWNHPIKILEIFSEDYRVSVRIN